MSNDTDADTGNSLTITGISGGSLGSYLDGTYGKIRLYSTGQYDYIADKDAADALDAGDSATDIFTYTVDDQTGSANATNTGTITIKVLGLNDPITAVNDTDTVNEDGSISRNTSSSFELDHDDTDPDGDDTGGNFTITAIRLGRSSESGTAKTVGTEFTTDYGTVTIRNDGSYDYAANRSSSDALAHGDTYIEYFTYTVSDGNGSTDEGELAITITGVGPQAVADLSLIHI